MQYTGCKGERVLFFFVFCQFVEQPRIEELLYSVRGQAVNIIARNSNRSSVGEIYEIQVKHLSTLGTWGGDSILLVIV